MGDDRDKKEATEQEQEEPTLGSRIHWLYARLGVTNNQLREANRKDAHIISLLGAIKWSIYFAMALFWLSGILFTFGITPNFGEQPFLLAVLMALLIFLGWPWILGIMVAIQFGWV